MSINFPALEDAERRLSTLLEEAGPQVDLSKVKSISGTDAEKAAAIRDLNAQVTDMKRIAELASLGNSESGGGSGQKSGETWADEVSQRVAKTVGQFGAKALTTGGIDVPAVVGPIVGKPVEPQRLIDLLIDRQKLSGNEFSYLRQTVRTNNAAAVADNALKPTSTYTFEEIEDRARVYAHLSEPFPLRYLADHRELRSVVVEEMGEDLILSIEKDAMVGVGTGEGFRGIANTPGILSQPFATDRLTSLRKARTRLLKAGESPTAWVLNHDDLEEIDLTVDLDTNFVDGIDEKIFGNLPKIGSSTIPPGTAYLGDWRQARLYVRQDATLDSDVSGDLFDKNQVKLRYECRVGFAPRRPAAWVAVALNAPTP